MQTAFDILGLAMDAIGAALPQYVVPVAFYGEHENARKLALTVKAVVVEDGALALSDGTAPVHTRAFTVRLPRSTWPDAAAPEIGEWLKIQWRGEWLWAKANAVNHMTTGDVAISAVQTAKDLGGPAWLR